MKHLLTAVAIILASPAFALDLSVPLKDQDDKPVRACADEKKPECEKIITLGQLVATALWRGSPDELDPRTNVNTLSTEEAIRRSELARSIYRGDDVKLKAEDVAMIKKIVTKLYPILTVEQIVKVVDPGK